MAFGSFDFNRDKSQNPALAAQMAALSFKPQAFQPVAEPQPKGTPSGLIGANPFNQAVFSGLKGRTETGLGFLRADAGQSGLGEKAILTQNGELGKKLFVSI